MQILQSVREVGSAGGVSESPRTSLRVHPVLNPPRNVSSYRTSRCPEYIVLFGVDVLVRVRINRQGGRLCYVHFSVRA